MNANNIAECLNVTLAYDGAVVLRDLSFDVRKGEILLISGENGSGKSTLVKALVGLIKPVAGSITVDGGGRVVGYLPQQASVNREFPASVYEIVSQGFTGKLKFGIFPPAGMKEAVKQSMEMTGVWSLRKKCFNELSGGQQQRVLLSRALCASRKLLILDEPSNGLDPESAAHMYEIIKNLRDEGMTVVMVSHDLETSVTLADRVLHLCCDGAFCCDAEEYHHRLHDVHAKNMGGLTHDCSCGWKQSQPEDEGGESGT